MSEWQPIETAPRDGMPVIVATREGHVGEAYLALDVQTWWWANQAPGDYYAESLDARWGAPTHWMPLPPPPGLKKGRPPRGGLK